MRTGRHYFRHEFLGKTLEPNSVYFGSSDHFVWDHYNPYACPWGSLTLSLVFLSFLILKTLLVMKLTPQRGCKVLGSFEADGPSLMTWHTFISGLHFLHLCQA